MLFKSIKNIHLHFLGIKNNKKEKSLESKNTRIS